MVPCVYDSTLEHATPGVYYVRVTQSPSIRVPSAMGTIGGGGAVMVPWNIIVCAAPDAAITTMYRDVQLAVFGAAYEAMVLRYLKVNCASIVIII